MRQEDVKRYYELANSDMESYRNQNQYQYTPYIAVHRQIIRI